MAGNDGKGSSAPVTSLFGTQGKDPDSHSNHDIREGSVEFSRGGDSQMYMSVPNPSPLVHEGHLDLPTLNPDKQDHSNNTSRSSVLPTSSLVHPVTTSGVTSSVSGATVSAKDNVSVSTVTSGSAISNINQAQQSNNLPEESDPVRQKVGNLLAKYGKSAGGVESSSSSDEDESTRTPPEEKIHRESGVAAHSEVPPHRVPRINPFNREVHFGEELKEYRYQPERRSFTESDSDTSGYTGEDEVNLHSSTDDLEWETELPIPQQDLGKKVSAEDTPSSSSRSDQQLNEQVLQDLRSILMANLKESGSLTPEQERQIEALARTIPKHLEKEEEHFENVPGFPGRSSPLYDNELGIDYSSTHAVGDMLSHEGQEFGPFSSEYQAYISAALSTLRKAKYGRIFPTSKSDDEDSLSVISEQTEPLLSDDQKSSDETIRDETRDEGNVTAIFKEDSVPEIQKNERKRQGMPAEDANVKKERRQQEGSVDDLSPTTTDHNDNISKHQIQKMESSSDVSSPGSVFECSETESARGEGSPVHVLQEPQTKHKELQQKPRQKEKAKLERTETLQLVETNQSSLDLDEDLDSILEANKQFVSDTEMKNILELAPAVIQQPQEHEGKKQEKMQDVKQSELSDDEPAVFAEGTVTSRVASFEQRHDSNTEQRKDFLPQGLHVQLRRAERPSSLEEFAESNHDLVDRSPVGSVSDLRKAFDNPPLYLARKSPAPSPTPTRKLDVEKRIITSSQSSRESPTIEKRDLLATHVSISDAAGSSQNSDSDIEGDARQSKSLKVLSVMTEVQVKPRAEQFYVTSDARETVAKKKEGFLPKHIIPPDLEEPTADLKPVERVVEPTKKSSGFQQDIHAKDYDARKFEEAVLDVEPPECEFDMEMVPEPVLEVPDLGLISQASPPTMSAAFPTESATVKESDESTLAKSIHRMHSDVVEPTESLSIFSESPTKEHDDMNRKSDDLIESAGGKGHSSLGSLKPLGVNVKTEEGLSYSGDEKDCPANESHTNVVLRRNTKSQCEMVISEVPSPQESEPSSANSSINRVTESERNLFRGRGARPKAMYIDTELDVESSLLDSAFLPENSSVGLKSGESFAEELEAIGQYRSKSLGSNRSLGSTVSSLRSSLRSDSLCSVSDSCSCDHTESESSEEETTKSPVSKTTVVLIRRKGSKKQSQAEEEEAEGSQEIGYGIRDEVSRSHESLDVLVDDASDTAEDRAHPERVEEDFALSIDLGPRPDALEKQDSLAIAFHGESKPRYDNAKHSVHEQGQLQQIEVDGNPNQSLFLSQSARIVLPGDMLMLTEPSALYVPSALDAVSATAKVEVGHPDAGAGMTHPKQLDDVREDQVLVDTVDTLPVEVSANNEQGIGGREGEECNPNPVNALNQTPLTPDVAKPLVADDKLSPVNIASLGYLTSTSACPTDTSDSSHLLTEKGSTGSHEPVTTVHENLKFPPNPESPGMSVPCGESNLENSQPCGSLSSLNDPPSDTIIPISGSSAATKEESLAGLAAPGSTPEVAKDKVTAAGGTEEEGNTH